MTAEFLYPERALSFFVFAFLIFFILRSHRMRRAYASLLETTKSLDRSNSFHAPKNRRLKEFFFVLGLSFVAFALMRPMWGEKERTRRIQGVDLCIAMDLSQSMLAEDMSPNRLAYAKRETTLLLEKLEGYRVSLVGFAGGAFIAAPLTTDLEAVSDLMSPLDTDFVSKPTTYLEGALLTCSEALGYEDLQSKEDDDKSSAGVILLVTDGDDSFDTDSDIVKGLKRKKITVNALLVGKDQAVQIPLRDNMGNLSSFVKDPETGAAASTKMETKKVKELTEESKGKIYLSQQIADFATLFSSDLKKFETKAREEGVEIEKEEQFQIPLLIALLFFFWEIFLTETGALWPLIRKRYLNFIWLLLLLNAPLEAAGLWESLRNNYGVFLFNRGKYQDARKWFQKNVESSPQDTQYLFNWAATRLNKLEADLRQLMNEGKMDPQQLAQSPSAREAAELAELLRALAEKESNPQWKKRWYYQLGNALELGGQSTAAIDAYYEALKEPKFDELDLIAKHNLARLLKSDSAGGGSGEGGGGGGGGQGGEGGADQQSPQESQGQEKQPQDYQGQNFTPNQVKQILQNVGSEERNVMKKKSREESKKRANEWTEGTEGKPW